MKYQGACLIILILRVATTPLREEKGLQLFAVDNEDDRENEIDEITLLISRGKKKGRSWRAVQPKIKMVVKNHDDNYAKEYYEDDISLPHKDSFSRQRNQPNDFAKRTSQSHPGSVRQRQYDEAASENIVDSNTTSAVLSAVPAPEGEPPETSTGLGHKMIIEIPLSVQNATSNPKANSSNKPRKPNPPNNQDPYAYYPYPPYDQSLYNQYQQPPYNPYEQPSYNQYPPPPHYNTYEQPPYNQYQVPTNDPNQQPPYNPYQTPTNNQYPPPPYYNPYQPQPYPY